MCAFMHVNSHGFLSDYYANVSPKKRQKLVGQELEQQKNSIVTITYNWPSGNLVFCFYSVPRCFRFFLPKIGQKCQIGDFWGYSGPNLATLWKSVSHFQFGGNLAFLGPKLTDFKVLPDLDVNFPQKSLILAFLADFWWFWIRIIWQRCGNSQNP